MRQPDRFHSAAGKFITIKMTGGTTRRRPWAHHDCNLLNTQAARQLGMLPRLPVALWRSTACRSAVKELKEVHGLGQFHWNQAGDCLPLEETGRQTRRPGPCLKTRLKTTKRAVHQ